MHKLYIEKSVYDKMIEIFNTENDNRDQTIANKLGISRHIIQHSLDWYLSKKRNYMGSAPKYEVSHGCKAGDYYIFINHRKFKSMGDAANYVRITKKELEEHLPEGECSVYVKLRKKQNIYHVRKVLK